MIPEVLAASPSAADSRSRSSSISAARSSARRMRGAAAAFAAGWLLSKQTMPVGASSSAMAPAKAAATVASGR